MKRSLHPRRATLTAIVAMALIATSLGGCSLLRTAPKTYAVTAYFQEAVALYPHSKVKVMGMDIGTVNAVKIDGSRIRVEMAIKRNVPLPLDDKVTIQALTIIGERNVVMSDAWKPGEPKMSDQIKARPDCGKAKSCFVIPQANTITPVEPDEGLKAIKNLIGAIAPDQLRSLVRNGAAAFGGNIPLTVNTLIQNTATLTSTLAAQDQTILQAAQNLHSLAAAANTRTVQLGQVLDGFSQATSTLADQRQAIATLLSGADQLVGAGTSLLEQYKGQLPTDLAELSHVGSVLAANADTFTTTITAFPKTAQGLVNAYDPKTHQLRLNVGIPPALIGIIDNGPQLLVTACQYMPVLHTVPGLCP